MKIIGILIVTTLLMGCASTIVKASKANTVPSERVTALPVARSTNPGKIIVVRDEGFTGGMAWLVLKVDGLEVAKFEQREKLEFDIDPGSHVFSVKYNRPLVDISPVELETTVQPDQKAYYRLGVGTHADGGQLKIQKSAELAD